MARKNQLVCRHLCLPRLDAATGQQRAHFEVYAGGRLLHWPEIDDDIEAGHVLEGRMPVKKPACASAVAEARLKCGR